MPEGTEQGPTPGADQNGESGLGSVEPNPSLQELYGDEGGQQQAPEVNANDEHGQGGESGEGGQQQEPPAAGALDPDAIADRIAQRWASQQPQPPAQQAKTYTDEELDQMFSVFKPTPELLTKLRSDDEQVAISALLEMRDGQLQQTMKVVEAMVGQALAKQAQQFAPALSLAQKQQAEQAEKEFYSGPNADLTKHKKVVDLVFGKMLASGARFPNKAAATKAVADETRALLKEMGVSTVAPTGNGAPQQQSRQMQPLSRGGAGGSSSGRSSAPSGISQTLRELA